MMRHRLFILLIFPVLLSCQYINGSSQSDSILIGEFSSLSGPFASFGQSVHKGVLMAIQEQNQAGGIKGKKIKLISLDDKGQTTVAVQRLKELTDDHQVLALIGGISSAIALAVAPIVQSKGIPLITPSSTNPKVTEAGDYIFRACFIDPFQGYVMAKFAYKKLGLKKIAILKDYLSEYSMGLANSFSRTFKDLGGEILLVETYQTGDQDFSLPLRNIRNHNPEGLFIPGYYGEVGMIAKQASELGIKATLLGGDGWDSDELYQIAKESIVGGYFASHYNPEATYPTTQRFVSQFQKQFDTTPDSMAAMGYDAAKILIKALSQTPSLNRFQLRQALTKIKNFPGVTGAITIDKARNPIKSAVVVQVQRPRNQYVTTIEP